MRRDDRRRLDRPERAERRLQQPDRRNGITIETGGLLRIDNSGPAGNNNTNRIADVAPIGLAGGTLQFLGNNSLATSETLGALTLTNGLSSVALTPGASTSKLTFASLCTGPPA